MPRVVALLGLAYVTIALLIPPPAEGGAIGPVDAHPAYGWPTLAAPTHGLTLAALPYWWQPIAKNPTPPTMTGLERVAGAQVADDAGGAAVFGRLLVTSGLLSDPRIYDISDPRSPTLLSVIPSSGQVGDVEIIPYPNGRLVAVFASSPYEHGARTWAIWEITDPRAPSLVSAYRSQITFHTVAVVPGTPIVYDATGLGARQGLPAEPALTGKTPIFDLSDPANPALVKIWENGYGCHEISFHIDTARSLYRGYCAAFNATQVWDVANPKDPVILATFPHPLAVEGTPSPIATFHRGLISHSAFVNHDASVLIIGDESVGAAAPTCDQVVGASSAQASGPFGNLWFYDNTDELRPILKGWISGPPALVNANASPCTAHNGRLIGESDLLAWGFYAGGVAIIDFSDPTRPVFRAHWAAPNGGAWDAIPYNGWIFTGDIERGMDVLRIT